MRNFRFLLAGLFFVIQIPAAAQTRAETVNWIHARYRNSGLVSEAAHDRVAALKINRDGSFEVKNSFYTSGAGISSRNLLSSLVIHGNFRDLNPETVTYTLEGNRLYINAHCSRQANCIRQLSLQFDKSRDSTREGSVLFGPILLTRESGTPAEAVNAFRRLIQLDGGKNDDGK